MKKILVAGCGHGGLSAACTLAEKGYDVTVFEKRRREDLGYDWHDSMRRNTFEKIGVPLPDESVFSPMERKTYSNPKKTVKLFLPAPKSNNISYIDRKFLINYLIDHAEKCGVKFIFKCEVICAAYDKNGVTGLTVSGKNGPETISADLVIDALGMYSPVRKGLPVEFGIQNEISYENVFCVWRGYFERTDKSEDDEFNIYFYHCNNPGMDWAIKKNGYYDIMIGGFGKLSRENVETALSDFRKTYPDMTDKLLRGGCFGKIPIGKTLPVFVCDGYALVGDSAAMTEPLSGSGLDMSLKAGKILADTIIENDDMKKESLWKYNYRFFKEHTEKYYNDAMIKGFLSAVTAQDIDFFFEKKILTEKEMSGGGSTKYTLSEILKKGAVLKKPRLIMALKSVISWALASIEAKKAIPEKYDRAQIEKFKAIYSKF